MPGMIKDHREQHSRDQVPLRRRALRDLEHLAPDDLRDLLSYVLDDLARRRRETQIDIIRNREFDPDNPNLERMIVALQHYEHLLAIGTALHTLIRTPGRDRTLGEAILHWSHSEFSSLISDPTRTRDVPEPAETPAQ
jgi:hypothetical protein